MTAVAVVGAHLTGQPLNHQLTGNGAVLRERTTTAPRYRLHRLPGDAPLRPALERVAEGGRAIVVEVWELDDAGLGRLTAAVAPPLAIGSLELADGTWVKGFVCELGGLVGTEDITAQGGWEAWLASRPAG